MFHTAGAKESQAMSESVKSDTETKASSKVCSSMERMVRKAQYRADRAAAAGIDLDGEMLQ